MSRQGKSHTEGWKWGGCSDNIKYGVMFSKNFVDAPERMKHQNNRNVKNLMNLHNNEAGRRGIERLMKVQCRCHGVSGSCELKTCWKTIPTFKEVGELLKEKYDRAVQVSARSQKKLRRKDKIQKKKPISKDDLVYIFKSPNYCVEDKIKGILGTSGRICNKTSTGPDSCDLLCCGRGYNTQVVRHVERCHCKFVWCCYVKCKTCITMVDIHTCK
uniref:Protein Wnt n=1 Tax=Euperipatoides kanangrensis TaxID=488523 RepID=A0A097ZRW6_9BILA|nr:WNT16 protein [Euperipatoides kanangrensis]